jgi:CRISPR system Cascade subunit CasE
MYFSLITPKPDFERQAAHEVLEWLSHDETHRPYAEHQWLWEFFDLPRKSDRPFLFRREDKSGQARFYLVSQIPPRSLYASWKVETREYRPKLVVGDTLCFSLRANPALKVNVEGKKHGARHDVVMHEKKRLLTGKGLQKWADWQTPDRPPLYELVRETCGAWLEKLAGKKGFALEAEKLAVDGYQPMKLWAGKDSNLRQFSCVDFSGELRVTDPEQFQKTLMEGIGPARAFGCGLLLVRPS